MIGLAPNIEAFLEHRMARRSDEMTMPTGGQVDRFAAVAGTIAASQAVRDSAEQLCEMSRAICERAREIVQQSRELRHRAASH